MAGGFASRIRIASGGSAQDDVAATTRWDNERASRFGCWRCARAAEEVTCQKQIILLRKWHTEKSLRLRSLRHNSDVLTTISHRQDRAYGCVRNGYAPKRDAAGKPIVGVFSPHMMQFTHANTMRAR
jgi:hypothetical protein